MKLFTRLQPFLFGLLAVLSAYSDFSGELYPKAILAPAIGSVAFTGFIYAIASALLPSEKVIAATSITVGFSLTLGDLFPSIAIKTGLNPAGSLALFLLIVLSVLLSCGYVFVRSSFDWSPINKIGNVVVGSLLLLTLGQIAIAEIPMQTAAARDHFGGGPRHSAAVKDSPARDVYYLIFDRYANDTTLKEFYGFDNSSFLSSLIRRGFYVAGESRANYLKTAHSLVSSLNLEHITNLSEIYGGETRNRRPLLARLETQEASAYLKSRGYHYVQIGSWWEATRTNRYADESYSYDRLSEFSRALLGRSILPYVGGAFGLTSYDELRSNCNRLNYQIDQLMEMPSHPGPKFVFAHFLLPHPPYVFSSQGNCFGSLRQMMQRDRIERYVSQVQFANQLIERFIERVSEQAVQPIIIVQGDEGPFPARYEANERGFNWREATPAELREKMRILNAYYLPGIKASEVLYPGITPVNTFRVVFNSYFGERYELLPDVSYAHIDDNRLYSFFDVTDIVKFR